MGSGGGGSMPAPDPQIGRAALMNAETGKEWLAFSKEAYAEAMERQKSIDALAKQVTEQALDTAVEQQGWSREAHDRYTDTFIPLQDRFIEEAESYDSPERRAEAAATARADVLNAANAEEGANKRQMAAMGINPNSGRWAGVQRAGDLGTAVAAAGASNTARRQVEATGLGLRASAINMGNGLPAQSAQNASLGMGAGTNAANVTNAAHQQFLSATPIMDRGFAGQMQGYANQANILQNQYNSQLQAYGMQQQASAQNAAGIMSGIGSIAGMFMSSKEVKTGKRKSKGNLKAVKKMPVENWRYKEGVQDGGAAEHTGPYAEDFKAATGMGNGKMISAQDAIGVTMGAVQELSGQVDRLEKKVTGLGVRPKRKAAKVKEAA